MDKNQMENKYPLFEQNRILKKELLWALRDYAFSHVALEYQEYADGIICGLSVSASEKDLVADPGIVKCGGFIYLISEKQRIPYQPADRIQILKLRMEVQNVSHDYISYRSELILNSDFEKKENEFELCRFHLREGARLRDSYTNFADMQTEYDTINLADSDFGGLRERTLSPAITGSFALSVTEAHGSTGEDLAFAWMCRNTPKTVAREVIVDYVKRRGGDLENEAPDNRRLFMALTEILNGIQGVERKEEGNKKRHRSIAVD